MIATQCASFVGTFAVTQKLTEPVPAIFGPYELVVFLTTSNKHNEDNFNSNEGINSIQSFRSKVQLLRFGFIFLPNPTLRKQLCGDVFLPAMWQLGAD